jgi:hypothetical protein
MCGNSMRENREIPCSPRKNATWGRTGENHTPVMHEHGKSDSPIVPAKLPNKAEAAEAVEGRGLTEGNANQQNTPRTQSRNVDVSSALDRMRAVFSLLPEVGAQCGSTARWDLWMGSGVTPIPNPTCARHGAQHHNRYCQPVSESDLGSDLGVKVP